MSRSVAALAMLLALAACGIPSGTPQPSPTAQPRRYTANVTVLESPEHGPQLCPAVQTSDPPQCSGPDVVGWDWKAVKHESDGGVRLGSYRVVGTWDGSRLTLTEPAVPAVRSDTPDKNPDLTTPCPEPEGGWRPVDSAKATQKTMEETLRRAQTADDYAGAWMDQSYLETIKGYDGSKREWAEKYANNPKRLVLNFRFTGDLAAREAWLREVWGGGLCLSSAEHPEAKLRAIADRAYKEIKGISYTSTNMFDSRVHLGVWVVTDELQREVDEKYGKGMVVLDGFLQPVDS